MSTTPTRLALLAFDVTGGDPAAVAAMLARFAQVVRHRAHADLGATLGEARHLLVEGVSVDDYFAAMASLKARDE